MNGHVGLPGTRVGGGARCGSPAKAIALGDAGRGLPRSHLFHDRRREIAATVECALVENHLAKRREVRRGGKQSAAGKRVARSIAQRLAKRIERRRLEARAVLRAAIAGGETRGLRVRRPERGVPHPERIEDPLLQKFRVGLAGDFFDEARDHSHAAVGVVKCGAGFALQGLEGQRGDPVIQRQIVSARHARKGKLARDPAGVA